MVTALLLLPVAGFLDWAYGYILLAAAAGAYPIILGLLAAGLAWRRRRTGRVPPR